MLREGVGAWGYSQTAWAHGGQRRIHGRGRWSAPLHVTGVSCSGCRCAHVVCAELAFEVGHQLLVRGGDEALGRGNHPLPRDDGALTGVRARCARCAARRQRCARHGAVV